MTSDHAQAVLFMCRQLTSSDHTVISANTDEKGEPQIFAQDATGKLAFFFVRHDASEPSAEDLARFRALAARHEVAAYYASVTLTPQPQCLGVRTL